MNLLLQLFINGLSQGAVYVLLAIGFGIIYRNLRIFHLAYAAIYIGSAYGTYFSLFILRLPLVFSVLIGLLTGVTLGLIIETFVYWPFYQKRATSGVILIASLGTAIFFENLISLLFGNELKVFNPGIEPSYRLGFVVLTRIQIIQLLLGYAIGFAVILYLKCSKKGKAIWALGDNPELIQVQGLSLKKLRLEITTISAFLASFASLLTAFDIGMSPQMGMNALLTGAIAAIAGGINTLIGWCLGAILLSEIQSVVVWKMSSKWNPLFTFLLLIIILIFKPEGILGRRR